MHGKLRLLLVSVDLTFSIRVSNLDPDQDPCSVGLDMVSNCLLRLLVDEKSRH